MRKTLSLLILLFAVGCSSKVADKPQPRPVKVVTVSALTTVDREFAALTTADDAVNLAFKLSGRVVDIPVAKGQFVKRGEVLAELDSRDVELQVSASKAAYTEAQSRLERARRLLQHDAISLQEVESLESGAAQALTVYENALDLLADTRILAPFDGVVERTYVDAWQRVQSGETVVRLVKPVSTTVGFTAPENLVSELSKPTTHFSVRFEAFPDHNFSAVIKSFARTSSDALGFPVSLRLTDVDSTKYSISPGMTCTVTVTLPERVGDAVVVPLTAIYAPQWGGDYVWVVDEGNRVALRGVELGEPVGDKSVAIRRGLRDGERVVVAGVYQLHELQRVTILTE